MTANEIERYKEALWKKMAELSETLGNRKRLRSKLHPKRASGWCSPRNANSPWLRLTVTPDCCVR